MLESRVSLDLRILIPAGETAFSGREPPTPDQAALSAARSLAAALGIPADPPFAWERHASLPALPAGASLSGLSLLVASAPSSGPSARTGFRATEIRLEEFSGRLVRRGGEAAMDWSSLGRPCLILRTGTSVSMGEAAESFLSGIKDLLSFLGIADPGALSESIRCNAYVSTAVRSAEGGARAPVVKIRNLNSLNFARKAINAEISRQAEVLASGGKIRPESRLWNEAGNRTEAFKDRPESPAPRYSPSGLEPYAPEEGAAFEMLLPDEPRSRQFANVLAARRGRYLYFKECLRLGAEAGTVARFICQDIARLERREAVALEYSGLSAQRLASIVGLLAEGRLTARMARELLEAVFIEGKDPEAIIAERGWKPVSDPVALGGVLDKLIAAHPDEAERVKGGDEAPRERLIGLAVKDTGGQADPVVLREVLREKLPSEAVRLILPESLKSVVAPEEYLPIRVRPSAWPQAREKGNQARSWASALGTIARTARKEYPRGVIASPEGPWTASLSAFIGFALSDGPLPIALVPSPPTTEADSSAEAWKDDLDSAIAFIEGGGTGTALFRNGEELRFPAPSMAPGAWDADEDIIASIIARSARETLVLSIFPGNLDLSLRLAESQGARNLILEFPDASILSDRCAPPELPSFLASLRKRGIIAVAAFREPGVSVPSGLRDFCARDNLVFTGLYDADAAYGRVLAAGLEAEDRDDMRKMLSETP